MAYFLHARATPPQRVYLPLRDATELLDSEYAHDMALYVQVDDIMLERVQLALDTSCCDASAKINGTSQLVFSRVLKLPHTEGSA